MKAEDIRRRLAELALDTNEYRINAGGALVLHGLREETHDLDIWCTKKLGDALAQRCDVQVLPDGTRRFVPAPDVEIYENMLPGETVFLDGIPVAPLEDVLALKLSLNREGSAGHCRSGSRHRRAKCSGHTLSHCAGGYRRVHGDL